MQRCVLFLVLLSLCLSVSVSVAQTRVIESKKEAVQKNAQEKDFNQKMVDFIRKLLADKPKPIDEKLIRDQM